MHGSALPRLFLTFSSNHCPFWCRTCIPPRARLSVRDGVSARLETFNANKHNYAVVTWYFSHSEPLQTWKYDLTSPSSKRKRLTSFQVIPSFSLFSFHSSFFFPRETGDR